jgi:hypothetical protein
MHLHAYTVTDLPVVPQRSERDAWEPDEVFSDAALAVTWLVEAMRQLCQSKRRQKDAVVGDFADEQRVWSSLLSAGESVHTGAGTTRLLVEAWPDCECDPQGDKISPLRRGRRGR